MDMIFDEGKAPMANQFLQEYQDILRLLRDNLKMAQDRQKKFYDQHRTKRSFEVGDMVYLRMQSFHQSSLKTRKVEKL